MTVMAIKGMATKKVGTARRAFAHLAIVTA
ncbi:hypothetical protein AB7M42_001533 [Bradyrhizobium diazoefficiens]|nr:hypothetical protein [Bradyrhizobium japonicum]MBP1095800.1 hypothetical protein [Bradyrhizobium japonicum]